MRLPISAIVEFSTPEDMLELAKLCDELGENSFADRLRRRSFNEALCARIADHRFVSLGHHNLYQNAYWRNVVADMRLDLLYCSVQHLCQCVGFPSDNEGDMESIDLSEIL